MCSAATCARRVVRTQPETCAQRRRRGRGRRGWTRPPPPPFCCPYPCPYCTLPLLTTTAGGSPPYCCPYPCPCCALPLLTTAKPLSHQGGGAGGWSLLVEQQRAELCVPLSPEGVQRQPGREQGRAPCRRERSALRSVPLLPHPHPERVALRNLQVPCRKAPSPLSRTQLGRCGTAP